MDAESPGPHPHFQLGPAVLVDLDQLERAAGPRTTSIPEGTDEGPHVGGLGLPAEPGV